jgi:hypothetical protein
MTTEQNNVVAGRGDDALTAWHQQKVAQDYSLFSGMFSFDVPPEQWVVERNGAEFISVANWTNYVYSENGEGVFKCDASAGDTTFVYSRRHPRYQSNRGHRYALSTATLPSKNAAATRDFGSGTSENAVFFRLKNGVLYACLMSGGALTREEKITLPDPLKDIDLEKGAVWDIKFQWRGVGNYFFLMGDPTCSLGELKKVHVFRNLNKFTGLSMENPAVPAFFRVVSLGDAAEIRSGCVDITTEGGQRQRYYLKTAYNTAPITTSGTFPGTPILGIRKPLSVDGKWNTRDSELMRVTVVCDKKATARLYLTRDTTAFSGTAMEASWTDLNGGHTQFTRFGINTAFDHTKAIEVAPAKLNANITATIDNPSPNKLEVFVVRGDHAVIMVESPSGNAEAVMWLGDEI